MPAIREMVFGFGWLMDGFCLRWGGGIISFIGIKIFVGKRRRSFLFFFFGGEGATVEKSFLKPDPKEGEEGELFSHPQIFGFRRNEGRRPSFSRTVVISQKYRNEIRKELKRKRWWWEIPACGFEKRNGKSVAVEGFFLSLFIVRQSPFRSARRFKTRFLKMFFWGNGRVMGL